MRSTAPGDSSRCCTADGFSGVHPPRPPLIPSSRVGRGGEAESADRGGPARLGQERLNDVPATAKADPDPLRLLERPPQGPQSLVVVDKPSVETALRPHPKRVKPKRPRAAPRAGKPRALATEVTRRPCQLVSLASPPASQGDTSAAFLGRALAWFALLGIRVQRVMTDNGSGYVSACFGAAGARHRLQHLRTRPYRPQTNGKAERFIQTLLREWAYVRPYRTSAIRARALLRFLAYYNRERPHGSLSGQPLISRLRARV